MNKRRERFLLKAEARRRTWGSAALVLAAIGFVVAALAVGVWLAAVSLRDPGPPPPELLRPLAVFVVLSLLALGIGLYTRLRPKHFVAIDVEAGTATFVQGGAVTRQVPLAEVGPLQHVLEQRRVSSGKSYRIATFHVARSDPFQELCLHESEDEMETRRALESRSRRWNVPYTKPSGEVRKPEDLDVPLFQRLGSDEAVTQGLPQRPDSKLAIAWKDDGYEITTSYRPAENRSKLVAMFGIPVLLLLWNFHGLLRGWLGEGVGTPYPWLAVGLVALALLPGTVVAARTWLRATRPPSIRVSPAGVRFRGRSLPLRSIEEVERVRGGAPRLVSDERMVQIDPDFCEASEYDWLNHELRRLVVETGLRSPVA